MEVLKNRFPLVDIFQVIILFFSCLWFGLGAKMSVWVLNSAEFWCEP